MINPNNKNLIIKLGYGAIKEEISKHRHICIMYYGEQSHFSQDILPRLTKLFKYVWETPYNLKLQYDIPYCNLIIPEQITNNDIQKQIRQDYVTADLKHIELLIEKSKIIRFKTMFDESNDETYVPLIDMITYNNERISIHNIMPWQHEMIFKRIEKSFIIKGMERAIKPGIVFQTLIVKA